VAAENAYGADRVTIAAAGHEPGLAKIKHEARRNSTMSHAGFLLSDGRQTMTTAEGAKGGGNVAPNL